MLLLRGSLYELHIHLYITCLYMYMLVMSYIIHRYSEHVNYSPFRPNLLTLYEIGLTLKVCSVDVVSSHLELEVLNMDHRFTFLT